MATTFSHHTSSSQLIIYCGRYKWDYYQVSTQPSLCANNFNPPVLQATFINQIQRILTLSLTVLTWIYKHQEKAIRKSLLGVKGFSDEWMSAGWPARNKYPAWQFADIHPLRHIRKHMALTGLILTRHGYHQSTRALRGPRVCEYVLIS